MDRGLSGGLRAGNQGARDGEEGGDMQLKTQEHCDLMAQFEREFKGRRLDREDKSLWAKGRIYQDGETNTIFLAYRLGCAYGRSVERMG